MSKKIKEKSKVTEEQRKIAEELMRDFKKADNATASLTLMAHAFCIAPKYQALGARMAALEKTIFEQFQDTTQVAPALSHIARAVLGLIYMDVLKSIGLDEKGLSIFAHVLTDGGMTEQLKAFNSSNELFEKLGVKSPMADVFEEEA